MSRLLSTRSKPLANSATPTQAKYGTNSYWGRQYKVHGGPKSWEMTEDPLALILPSEHQVNWELLGLEPGL